MYLRIWYGIINLWYGTINLNVFQTKIFIWKQAPSVGDMHP